METREQAEQAAANWIARRETGPWSEEDAAGFEQWLAGSMTRRVACYRYKKAWQDAGRLGALASGPLPERPLAGTFDSGDIAAMRAKRARAVGYALAATVVLSVAAALFMFRDDIFGFNTYQTAVGGLTTVPMPDGSRVTLNTDSELRVSVDERERRAELKRGEAFFEVTKDPRRPFVVIAGDKRILVVGTQFSVRRQDNDIRVSVTEGAVRLIASPASRAAEQQPGLLLRAGVAARAERTGVVVQNMPVAAIEQQLTWRTGILTFHNTPLMNAVAEFNRYNQRQIFIEDPGIATIEIGGVFRATDLDPFIRLIEGTLPLRASRDGNRILLSGR